MASSPANSPCAPELGCSDTPAKPVIAQSAAESSLEDLVIPLGLVRGRERVHPSEVLPRHREQLARPR